jgi:hypothetical protein
MNDRPFCSPVQASRLNPKAGQRPADIAEIILSRILSVVLVCLKGYCKRDAYNCLGSSGTLEPAGSVPPTFQMPVEPCVANTVNIKNICLLGDQCKQDAYINLGSSATTGAVP